MDMKKREEEAYKRLKEMVENASKVERVLNRAGITEASLFYAIPILIASLVYEEPEEKVKRVLTELCEAVWEVRSLLKDGLIKIVVKNPEEPAYTV